MSRLLWLAAGFILSLAMPRAAFAAESLVIAASPSVSRPIEALSRRFESTHPHVRVRVSYDTALSLRQTIATVENRGPYFIGTGPIHLIAPAGDELIARLQQKYYVLPGTTATYATVPLALVVPESLVEAPASFEAAVRDPRVRISIADPALTSLGQETIRFLESLPWGQHLTGRLDIAADAAGVLDHLLNGQADVAIMSGPDAAREGERVRVIDVADGEAGAIKTHSMAMERSCPNRALCREFLAWIKTAEAQAVLRSLGYGPRPQGRADAAAH